MNQNFIQHSVGKGCIRPRGDTTQLYVPVKVLGESDAHFDWYPCSASLTTSSWHIRIVCCLFFLPPALPSAERAATPPGLFGRPRSQWQKYLLDPTARRWPSQLGLSRLAVYYSRPCDGRSACEGELDARSERTVGGGARGCPSCCLARCRGKPWWRGERRKWCGWDGDFQYYWFSPQSIQSKI